MLESKNRKIMWKNTRMLLRKLGKAFPILNIYTVAFWQRRSGPTMLTWLFCYKWRIRRRNDGRLTLNLLPLLSRLERFWTRLRNIWKKDTVLKMHESSSWKWKSNLEMERFLDNSSLKFGWLDRTSPDRCDSSPFRFPYLRVSKEKRESNSLVLPAGLCSSPIGVINILFASLGRCFPFSDKNWARRKSRNLRYFPTLSECFFFFWIFFFFNEGIQRSPLSKTCH